MTFESMLPLYKDRPKVDSRGQHTASHSQVLTPLRSHIWGGNTTDKTNLLSHKDNLQLQAGRAQHGVGHSGIAVQASVAIQRLPLG